MTPKASYIIISMILNFLCLVIPTNAQKVEKNDYFYILNTHSGLSDNHILQMIQLSDGRMAIETNKGINIYDGKKFQFIPLTSAEAHPLSSYKGHIHLYADNKNRLWIKNTQQVFCADLNKCQLINNPLNQLTTEAEAKQISDLFVDSNRNVWYMIGNHLTNATTHHTISLKESWGNLQDMDIDAQHIYTFHETGIVAAFTKGVLDYTASAYPSSKSQLYSSTSLIVKTPHEQFYQIRTGFDKSTQKQTSIFLHFDPHKRKYETIFNCDYILHTLNMSSDNQALISSQHGYLMFDFKLGNSPREVRELALPDGKSLVTGINTVYKDQDGGIWLGTYNDGLIYVSPMLGLFFTIDKPWWHSAWNITMIVFFLLVLGIIIYLSLQRRKKMPPKSHDVIEEIPTPDEPIFLQKARLLVEQHLQDGEYGVEQLANDLCMERTGLYKKLKSLSDTTPVAFIRNIRLQRAAVLLKEGKMTVNEIAESTGFGSSSYFTKCFKNAFGVLPSEYK